MEAQPSEDREILLTCFNGISDPRGSNVRHPLQSVLFIAMCAVISGAESWDDIELYALSKKEWLIFMSQLIKAMVAWSSDVVQSLDWLEQRTSWQGLCSLIKLESSREILSTGQNSTEV